MWRPGSARSSADRLQYELVPLSASDDWARALGDVPHPHAHTWEHAAAFQASTGDPTYLVVGRGPSGQARVVCPIAERRWMESVDAYTPYGFGGFSAAGPVPGLAQAWQDLAHTRDWTTSFVALNPLFEGHLDFPDASVVPAHSLYFLDLRPSIADLLSSMSRGRARQLRRWDRAPGRLSWDRSAVLAFMQAQAPEFFSSRGASAVCSFTPTTWQLLLDAPSVLAVAVIEADRVVGAGVFGHAAPSADALFAITLPGYQGLMAPLVWEGTKALKARGVESLNLGGAIRDGDGIAEFKRMFGCFVLRSRSLHLVHDEERFAALCRRRGVDPAQRSGYFPPYYQGSPG